MNNRSSVKNALQVQPQQSGPNSNSNIH